MNIFPNQPEFTTAYDAGRSQVMWCKLPSDVDTPVSAMLKLGQERPFTALFESVQGGSVRGRYSFIAIEPDVVWRCNGNQADLCYDIKVSSPTYKKDDKAALESLRALIAESHIDLPDGMPPMAAGLIGFMGYDTIRLVENIPSKNPDTLGIPEGMFMRPTITVIFDNVDDVLTIVTPIYPKKGIRTTVAYAAAQSRILNAVTALERAIPHNTSTPLVKFDEPTSNTGRDGYYKMVERAKEYILEGDIFQVVPSQRFRLPFTLPSFSLYRSLRRLNPSPFLFHLNLQDFSIVGSSPEILVRLRDSKVTIRPIAGTRPRGRTIAEDQALSKELLADPKECAEHLMLLDLGRNDVGRVCKTGTVEVTERMTVEYYSHVMHIVSNVQGEIDPTYDALDALMAGFPAGTVSGAPKVRAMEIIDELEKERRGFYAGAIGYLSSNGDMDTCIALRTALVKDGELIIQAGGGVVADSDPESEFQESNNKAQALVRAAEEAIKLFSGNSTD